MISVSVRSALNLEGRSASLRQIVSVRNVPIPRWFYPLSLRAFVGALPPGQILSKVIPLDLLQRKFDEFINRELPLVKLRLHGTDTGAACSRLTG